MEALETRLTKMRGNRELSDKHLPGQGFQCQTSMGAKKVVRSDQVLEVLRTEQTGFSDRLGEHCGQLPSP